jgi:hypothetical protein
MPQAAQVPREVVAAHHVQHHVGQLAFRDGLHLLHEVLLL